MVKPLFKDGDEHIKKMSDFQKSLRRVRDITPQEERLVLERAKKVIHTQTGMSKKEYLNKVVRPLQMDTKDQINPEEALNLRKLAK